MRFRSIPQRPSASCAAVQFLLWLPAVSAEFWFQKRHILDGKSVAGLAQVPQPEESLGGALLSYISSQMGQPNLVGAIQAVALFAILAVTLLYMRNESKVQTLHLARSYICLVIGFALGVCSSFLGIGGGPLNLVVLYYFFSMQKKEAAQNSLFIILIAQAANLMYAACRQKSQVCHFLKRPWCCSAA